MVTAPCPILPLSVFHHLWEMLYQCLVGLEPFLIRNPESICCTMYLIGICIDKRK
jgi:hypothetical protein